MPHSTASREQQHESQSESSSAWKPGRSMVPPSFQLSSGEDSQGGSQPNGNGVVQRMPGGPEGGSGGQSSKNAWGKPNPDVGSKGGNPDTQAHSPASGQVPAAVAATAPTPEVPEALSVESPASKQVPAAVAATAPSWAERTRPRQGTTQPSSAGHASSEPTPKEGFPPSYKSTSKPSSHSVSVTRSRQHQDKTNSKKGTEYFDIVVTETIHGAMVNGKPATLKNLYRFVLHVHPHDSGQGNQIHFKVNDIDSNSSQVDKNHWIVQAAKTECPKDSFLKDHFERK